MISCPHCGKQLELTLSAAVKPPSSKWLAKVGTYMMLKAGATPTDKVYWGAQVSGDTELALLKQRRVRILSVESSGYVWVLAQSGNGHARMEFQYRMKDFRGGPR